MARVLTLDRALFASRLLQHELDATGPDDVWLDLRVLAGRARQGFAFRPAM